MKPPALASLLYAIEIPPIGGDTQFCSLYAAYEALSPALRSFLEGLSAVHDFGYASRGVFKAELAKREQLDATPAVEHKIITTHPETGKKSCSSIQALRRTSSSCTRAKAVPCSTFYSIT